MLRQEIININGKEYTHTYSDTYYIRQIETGIVYTDAIDICPCPYTYEETDEPLPKPESGGDDE
jgi:hypothetical protein